MHKMHPMRPLWHTHHIRGIVLSVIHSRHKRSMKRKPKRPTKQIFPHTSIAVAWVAMISKFSIRDQFIYYSVEPELKSICNARQYCDLLETKKKTESSISNTHAFYPNRKIKNNIQRNLNKNRSEKKLVIYNLKICPCYVTPTRNKYARNYLFIFV